MVEFFLISFLKLHITEAKPFENTSQEQANTRKEEETYDE